VIKKRKSWLKSILTMKTGGFGVNEFLLIKKAYIRCFFFFLKMVDLNLKMFLFRVDCEFWN